MCCHPLCKTNTFQCISYLFSKWEEAKADSSLVLAAEPLPRDEFYLESVCFEICHHGSVSKPLRRNTSVRSSKQVCPIDQSPDNILSSFPFCCVVMSLDVIAAMTLETGQPTFCPSDWTATLHWRLCNNS